MPLGDKGRKNRTVEGADNAAENESQEKDREDFGIAGRRHTRGTVGLHLRWNDSAGGWRWWQRSIWREGVSAAADCCGLFTFFTWRDSFCSLQLSQEGT